MNKYYHNLYLALMVDKTRCKVITQIVMAENTRSEVVERAKAKASKYGWDAKVFPAHYGRYGKIKIDYLNTQTV